MLRQSAAQAHRTRRSPEERREQIMAAAVKLFARQGFARTTTKEIAQEAGLSEGTIYKYFASKQELLFAFIAQAGVETLRPVLEGREGESEAEVVRGFFLDRLTLARRNLPLMKVVLGEALFDEKLAQAFASNVARPIISLLEELLNSRIRAGRLRGVEARTAAQTLAGLFITFGILWPVLLPREAGRFSPEELAGMLTSLYLEGMAPRPVTAKKGKQR